MAEENPNVMLRNGVKVPLLGLGITHSGGYIHDTVVYALKDCGYRHLDTAKRYGVERYLAQAISDSGIDRSEVFLSTKLWPTDYGQDKTAKAAQKSMERLNTDYLDLYMMHFPTCPSNVENPNRVLIETWRQLELLLDKEQIRAIGVSNFDIEDLEILMDSMETSMNPLVNQCEFHPYNHPKSLLRFCQDAQIQFEGYCPLAKGKILNEPPVVRVAKKLQKSPAQVLIKWSIQHDVLTIPKSTKKHRVLENFQALDFEIPDKEMNLLDNLNQQMRIIDLSDLQLRLDQDLPDGYKMKKFPCILPDFIA